MREHAMPRAKDAIPIVPTAGGGLPPGWEEAKCEDGKTYYIDHNGHRTSWIDPRDHLIKPRTFSDCIGHEMPLGWEECYDSIISTYYIDHNREINQIEDPRRQWHEEQENMLQEYLKHAAVDLEAQQMMMGMKEQALDVAEKMEYINEEAERAYNEFGGCPSNEGSRRTSYESSRCPSYEGGRRTSNGSCTPLPESSVDPISTDELAGLSEDTSGNASDTTTESVSKYNPAELKEYIANAHERVGNLKREMSANVSQQVEGMNKLINRNCDNGEMKSLDGGDQISLDELKEAHERLLLGEREKIQIIEELLRQKEECCDNLSLDTYSGNQMNGSSTSLNSSGSICSNPGMPFMGSNENLGTGLAKRQLRKDYQHALQKVKELHDALQDVDYQLEASHTGHEQHQYMLNNEKQVLLSELDRFAIYIKTEEERANLEYEKDLLLQDLLAMEEMSSKVIENRLQLQSKQEYLKQRLMEKNQQTNMLELRLKSLSASTLSISSTSSRGSMSTGSRGSLSASSRGSLNSCHYTDNGGSSDHYSSLYHISSNNFPPIYESHILATKAESKGGLTTTTTSDRKAQQYLSSTNLSVNPTYHSNSIPTSYSTNILSNHPTSLPLSLPNISSNAARYAVSAPVSPMTGDLPPLHAIAQLPVSQGNTGMYCGENNGNGRINILNNSTNNVSNIVKNNTDDGSYRSYAQFPLTSYRCTMGSLNDISQNYNFERASIHHGRSLNDISRISQSERSSLNDISHNTQFDRTVVPNAASNESVAADSGVFESFNELRKSSVTRQDSGHSSGVYCSDVETAQIRIGLEYKCPTGKLALTIEKGRNVKALCFQPLKHVYVSGNLLPPSPPTEENFHITTRVSINTDRPCFNEQFLFTIDRNKLITKTLQLDLFGMLIENNVEECLGCSQISLAEFDSNPEIGLKWYNLLGSFTNMRHQPGLNRSDSSSSLEAVHQQFNTLPSLVASSEDLNAYDQRNRSNSYNRSDAEIRERANSNDDRCSMNSSQSNLASNSLCGSSERMHRYTPPHAPSCVRPHHRSRSDEREEQSGDVNIARSASDCTGCRKAPLRAPFIRMGVCRRSIRKTRLAELASRKSVVSAASTPPIQPAKQLDPLRQHEQMRHSTCVQDQIRPELVRQQHITKEPSPPVEKYANIHRRKSGTPLESEDQIRTALSDQETEITFLKEIKQMMENTHKWGGKENISQWLLENEENFRALLDEAKKGEYSHLSGLAYLSTESLASETIQQQTPSLLSSLQLQQHPPQLLQQHQHQQFQQLHQHQHQQRKVLTTPPSSAKSVTRPPITSNSVVGTKSEIHWV